MCLVVMSAEGRAGKKDRKFYGFCFTSQEWGLVSLFAFFFFFPLIAGLKDNSLRNGQEVLRVAMEQAMWVPGERTLWAEAQARAGG